MEASPNQILLLFFSIKVCHQHFLRTLFGYETNNVGDITDIVKKYWIDADDHKTITTNRFIQIGYCFRKEKTVNIFQDNYIQDQ